MFETSVISERRFQIGVLIAFIEAFALAEQLDATRAEADRWRSEARDLMQGLGEALDQQFDRWSLTPAEKEVALLLLKGLSHKDIARAAHPRSVRGKVWGTWLRPERGSDAYETIERNVTHGHCGGIALRPEGRAGADRFRG